MNDSPASEQQINSLAVISLAIIAERFSQRNLWLEIKKLPGQRILPDDPSYYYSTESEKRQGLEWRIGAGIEWAARTLVEGWTIPDLEVSREPTTTEGRKRRLNYDKLDEYRASAGLHWHRFIKIGHILNNYPDRALHLAFQFFDKNPDVPLLLVYSDHYGNLGNGQRKFSDTTQSVAVLAFARRDRVEWLRYFAPYTRKPDGTAYPQFWKWRSTPPKPFTPTRFFPEPWTTEQLAMFDQLPDLAIVHRPILVSYRKDDGAPQSPPVLMKERERQAAFAEGWARALALLPHDERGEIPPVALPQRVFYDYGAGPKAYNFVPATLALMHNPAFPELPLADPAFGINLWTALGDPGANMPMLGWSIAAMATSIERNTSVVLNLRDDDHAVITVIEPPAVKPAEPSMFDGWDPFGTQLR